MFVATASDPQPPPLSNRGAVVPVISHKVARIAVAPTQAHVPGAVMPPALPPENPSPDGL